MSEEENLTNAQIIKLMQSFDITAKDYHVDIKVQAEAALLIFYFICDNFEISSATRDKFIQDVKSNFENMKQEFGNKQG
jgi:hypothetical protein